MGFEEKTGESVQGRNVRDRRSSCTRQVMVGNVAVGGGAPVAVQSMLNAAADDEVGNLRQLDALAQAGCEIARMAVPRLACVPVFERICKQSPLPVVADIHFDADIAIQAAYAGAAKLRINPGNIGGLDKTRPVLAAAKECGIPIRIGVNGGSLDAALAAREDLTPAQRLAQSAIDYVAFCKEEGFEDIVVSTKAHDVPTTIETYRILHEAIPQVPLHIGITEAGTAFQGLIKSAAGLGVLLEQGIGDTLRISLTDDPTYEVRAAWTLLGALGLRHRGPELISCPTCGRTQVDLINIAKAVEDRMSTYVSPDGKAPLKVAVMGCVVNGPGEAKDADIGVACGPGIGMIFVHGEVIRKVAENEIVDALMEEIERL